MHTFETGGIDHIASLRTIWLLIANNISFHSLPLIIFSPCSPVPAILFWFLYYRNLQNSALEVEAWSWSPWNNFFLWSKMLTLSQNSQWISLAQISHLNLVICLAVFRHLPTDYMMKCIQLHNPETWVVFPVLPSLDLNQKSKPLSCLFLSISLVFFKPTLFSIPLQIN